MGRPGRRACNRLLSAASFRQRRSITSRKCERSSTLLRAVSLSPPGIETRTSHAYELELGLTAPRGLVPLALHLLRDLGVKESLEVHMGVVIQPTCLEATLVTPLGPEDALVPRCRNSSNP